MVLPQPDVTRRYRVIARGLVPACVALALLLCGIALALDPAERLMVRPIPPIPEAFH